MVIKCQNNNINPQKCSAVTSSNQLFATDKISLPHLLNPINIHCFWASNVHILNLRFVSHFSPKAFSPPHAQGRYLAALSTA